LKLRDDLLATGDTEIQELKAKVEELEREIYEATPATEPSEAFSTMEGTVMLFQAIAATSPVVVLPSAIRSASQCASKRRLEVLQLLLTLRELASLLFERNGQRPGPLRDWFAAQGYEYAPQDSETTTTKHGKTRTFLVDGEPLLFREHVTLFENSPDCVQVYFQRDSENRRLLVGYCGAHLPVVSRGG